MIHVDPLEEPPDFDQRCREPGLEWLEQNQGNSTTRPPAKWTQFMPALAEAFHERCAYSAMFVYPGTVDHYLSWKNHPEPAYEWSNYRYAAQWINSAKQNVDAVLDPFAVEDGWFELLLPSLQLVVTDAVPDHERARAEYTLNRLHLRDDERVIRQRRAWYELYERGQLDLAGLERMAPLLARAIRRRIDVESDVDAS